MATVTITEQQTKPPSFFVQVFFLSCLGLLVLAFNLLTIGLTKFIVTDVYHAIILSNQGISTSAKVLDSKSTHFRYAHTAYTSYDHFIQYKKFRNTIALDRNYPAGSNVDVIYDHKDPSLVWQGNGNMSMLALYLLNSDASHGDLFSFVYIHAGYFLFLWIAYLFSKVVLTNIRILINEKTLTADPVQSVTSNHEMIADRGANKGRKFLIGFIILLVVAIASISCLMMKPSVSDSNDLTQANEYLITHDIKMAEAAFTEAIRKNPKSAAAYAGRAKAYLLNRQADAALSDIDTAIRLGKDDAESHFLRGIVFVGKEDHTKALSEYAIALEKDPYFREAHLNSGISFYGLKDYANAVKEYKKYIEGSANGDPGIEKAKQYIAIADKEAAGNLPPD